MLIDYRTNYIVCFGDTLYTVARKFGITIQSIVTANQLKSPLLQEGQKLILPIRVYGVQFQGNTSRQPAQYLPVTAYTATQPIIVNGTDINKGVYTVLNYKPAGAPYPYIYVPIAEFSRVGANVVWDPVKQVLTVTTDYYTLKSQVGSLTDETEYLKLILDSIINDGQGNTAGNIMETAFVAQESDWLYYRMLTKYYPTSPGYLYKIKTDGTGNVRLSNDTAYYINVLNGWVYYTDLNKMYKVRTDGTDRTQIGDEYGYQMTVVGSWIYYSSGSDGGKLYKINIDGTNRTKLNDDISNAFNFIQDWIYYRNGSDGNKPYKIRTDGTGRVKLNDIPVLGNMTVIDDWIYYWAQTSPDINNIYRVRLDGANVTRLSDDNIERMNISGGYIYYTKVNSPPGGDLYKMRLDGTNKFAFNISFVIQLNVIGNWVYYLTNEKTTYKVRTDGTGNVAMYPVGQNI